MKHVSITQAREQLSKLIDFAQSGHPVILTRRGKPVAKIVAIMTDSRPGLPDLAAFRQSISAMQPSVIRELRDQERS